MSEVKIDTVEKNTDKILEKIGKDSFVQWDTFSQSSSQVARSIDELSTALGVFRQIQHKNFIQTMKKLKSLDVPDLLQAVKGKKLPKEALRGVLGRFKLEGQNLQLVETVEQLRENAKKQFDSYVEKNKEFTTALKSYTQFINKKAQESGLLPSQQTIAESKLQIKSTVKFNLNEDTANKIASEIKIQYLTGTQFISFETYNQIVEGTFKLIKDEYKKLTTEGRIKQRQSIKNHKEYLTLMNEYLMNGEALINQGQAFLARKVGISQQKLGQSQMALMDRGFSNNLLMVQSQLRGKIKESIQSEKDVSVQVAKEIVRYQVSLIEDKSKQINSILSGLQKGPETIQMVPMLLALILNDYVFEKYGYEEEDFMKNLGEEVITTNPQFVKIFRDMEMSIMKLMQNLDIIPPEVAEMMKQQQAFMQQMGSQGLPPGLMMPPGMGAPGIGGPGMGGPGMGGPGMMPGMGQSSNPMDMLQMQQMQQMQAMFSQMGIQPPK